MEPSPSKTICVQGKKRKVTHATLEKAHISKSIDLFSMNDAKALVALENATFDQKLYGDLINHKNLSAYHRKGNGLILTAFIKKRLAGYARIDLRKNTANARFYSLAVHPDFQGVAVGRTLFKSIEKICPHLGVTKLLLEIREDNTKLFKRYSQVGYTPYKTVKNYYADGAACIKMQKTVP